MSAVETSQEKWCEAKIHQTAGELTLMSLKPRLCIDRTQHRIGSVLLLHPPDLSYRFPPEQQDAIAYNVERTFLGVFRSTICPKRKCTLKSSQILVRCGPMSLVTCSLA
jgi:hypothetical protein